MEHLNHWFQCLTASQWENLVWIMGCALLVAVWCVGFRMAQPRVTAQGASVPSSPLVFGLVVCVFVLLAAALTFAAYELYMQAYVQP